MSDANEAQMRNALQSATTAYTSGPSFKSTEDGIIDRFTAGFMYGWADAKNGEVPHENAKKGERETEYSKIMNGPDNEGAFVRGYSDGWKAQKSLT